jgi:hypothetical protein
MLEKVPDEVQGFINRYFELNIKKTRVICPYFINEGVRLLTNPIFAGKGTPEEIESAAVNLVENSGNITTADEIRDLMHKAGLGIDCSGLVYQIYDFWLQDVKKSQPISAFLPKVNPLFIRKYLSRKMKPQSSFGANEQTSSPFATKIELSEVRPGDLIRSRGGKHILFIIEVEKDEKFVNRIKFVHSSRQYQRDGVRYGEIHLDKDQSLATAKWEDNDQSEPVNYAYQGFRESINTNGIFRANLHI